MQLLYCERMGGETIKLVNGLSFSSNVTLSLALTFHKIHHTKDRSLLVCDPLMLQIPWIHRKPCFFTLETVKIITIRFLFISGSLFAGILRGFLFRWLTDQSGTWFVRKRRLNEQCSDPTEIMFFGFSRPRIDLFGRLIFFLAD